MPGYCTAPPGVRRCPGHEKVTIEKKGIGAPFFFICIASWLYSILAQHSNKKENWRAYLVCRNEEKANVQRQKGNRRLFFFLTSYCWFLCPTYSYSFLFLYSIGNCLPLFNWQLSSCSCPFLFFYLIGTVLLFNLWPTQEKVSINGGLENVCSAFCLFFVSVFLFTVNASLILVLSVLLHSFFDAL